MKKTKYLGMLLALCLATACSEEALDDMSGKYDMERYDFRKVEQQDTEKLGKGIKSLNMKLYNESDDVLELSIASTDWVLQSGTYTCTDKLTANKQYKATLNSQAITGGNLDINLVNGTYFFNGMLETEGGNSLIANFKGALTFEIGVDDPEASGYTATLSISPVAIMENGQFVGFAPGVSQYSFKVTDPDGNSAGQFDAINAEGTADTALPGKYTVKAGATEAWQMGNGYGLPAAWGGAYGGSHIVKDGVRQYLDAGQISITLNTGTEGETLISFEGTDLTMNLGIDENTFQGIPCDNKTVSIKFATLLQSTGIELRDQTISSQVLGKDMKYSVYLPKSYDGTREYPVLYLLHGYGGGNNDWLNGGQVNPYASQLAEMGGKEMIVVCPDGMNAFYCNGYQDGMQYMTYFFDEFLPTIESTFKVKAGRENRAIGGLSMGGYGSLYYGLLHPEMFCHVYACSPAAGANGAPDIFQLITATPAADMPGFTIETGTEDPVVTEQPSWIAGAMTQAGVECEYIARTGIHDWAFWSACTPKILQKVSACFQ